MDFGLKEKTALVLGAGGGLGSAIATTLAAEGAKVAVADVNADAANKTVGSIVADGGNAIALSWNLENLGAIDSQISTIEQRFGAVDIVVNNTGGPPPTPASGQPPDMWASHFQSMVLSVIAITDRILPSMKRRQWGRIITSASSGVISPIPNLAISNSLRLTLVGWSKTLAREVGADGITVNVICPGRIATSRITALDKHKAEWERRAASEVVAESTASIPLKRYGNPNEYADVVTFLASERASYVTGSVIRVDGGLIPSI
ncbi:SDR family oxidoreductase [Bradyrhizobium sp. 187]|uniref:SDR family oxidoreductase n=1 Tax=Bradyrhizobium sp. 187 TaxID=2782655 RepID=UPI001FFFA6F5|nr:SDR family oxidoreductase [Bradyrhizobium sp. 187]UPJ71838.1 SDR family oxidoreductase [Bradyrhizobium sp. 187]